MNTIEIPKAPEHSSLENQIDQFVIVTHKGYATRVRLERFGEIRQKGTKGIRVMDISEERGSPIYVKKVTDDSLLYLVTAKGKGAIIPVSEIHLTANKPTGGALIFSLDEGDIITTADSN